MRIVLAILSCVAVGVAQHDGWPVPTVCLVAEGARGDALDAMLRGAGLPRRRVAVADCVPEALRFADVVVVDWPEDAPFGERMPLGQLERWDRPTVFVGATGDRFARAWRLPTAAEMVGLPLERRGIEMQHLVPPEGATTGVERQGHLFHFTCRTAPTEFAPDERAWFAAVVHEAARFVTDRPIVRQPSVGGAPLPDAEVARRARIAEAAQVLGCDVRRFGDLAKLRPRWLGGDKARVDGLLADLLGPGWSDGPQPQWIAWLARHDDEFTWDDLSFTWRLDPLAAARGRWSRVLQGDKRADGSWRSPDVTAVVDAIARRHGARGFADLATFRCRHGGVVCLWDLRGGWFRMENHGLTPRGVPPWRFVVYDTTKGRCVPLAGEAPQLPDVRARQGFQELIVRVFLPVLLLRPGADVQRGPDDEDHGERDEERDGETTLRVRFAHPGIDPRLACRVRVAADGSLTMLQWRIEQPHGPAGGNYPPDRSSAAAPVPCGPMLLPTTWSLQDVVTYAVTDCEWNPELPADLATANDYLTESR